MATPILGITELEASQNQKYLTVNTALRAIDALVNLTVFNRTQTSPPGSPTDGDRYIVSSPATGSFLGQENNVATYVVNSWLFVTPSEGWRSYDQGANELIIFDGSVWNVFSGGGGGGGNYVETDNSSAQGMAGPLGINGATSDSTNVLSVNGPSVLFSNSGNNSQVKINKAGLPDTASLLFQNNFSSRAEMGVTSSDDFEIKVSSDGSTFKQSVLIDKDTGSVRMPNGGGRRSKTFTGRILIDENWRGADGNFGSGYHLVDDAFGSGATPTLASFDFNTIPLKTGVHIRRITMIGRVNITDPTDINIHMSIVSPTTEGQWSSGLVTFEEDVFLSDKFITPSVGTANTAALNVKQRRIFNVDHELLKDGVLFFAFKAESTPSADRFFYGCFEVEYEDV